VTIGQGTGHSKPQRTERDTRDAKRQHGAQPTCREWADLDRQDAHDSDEGQQSHQGERDGGNRRGGLAAFTLAVHLALSSLRDNGNHVTYTVRLVHRVDNTNEWANASSNVRLTQARMIYSHERGQSTSTYASGVDRGGGGSGTRAGCGRVDVGGDGGGGARDLSAG
jgi:hypothetical protein